MKIIFLMSVLLVLTSCAANKRVASSADCKSNDWSSLGARDGKMGQDKIKDIMAVCNVASPLQTSSYRQGFAKGLDTFCTYESGKSFAAKGMTPPNVCPPNLNKALMQGYNEWMKKEDSQTKKL